MKEDIVSNEHRTPKILKMGILDGLARKMLFSLLGRLRKGRITILEGGARHVFGERSERNLLEAIVTVHRPFYRRALFGGSIGAGEAYMGGLWSADDLTTLIRIILMHQDLLESMDYRYGRVTAPVHKLFHFLHRGTKEKSVVNIKMHYDLGNSFYATFLDETMTYSCGIFETQSSSLKEASIAKYDRICNKLQLNSEDHVLEIGSGWGGFAIHAARNYGCRVTTTTISRAQYEFAKERIKSEEAADRVNLLLEDYRDLRGKYDKAVSIEMIEAVGHQYYDTFFRSCSGLLKDDGMMLLQAITIADYAFDRHKREVDFIKRYIFPGSCIPSLAAMASSIARATNFRLFHLEDITPHYARTLRAWRDRFFENIEDVRRLGFSESFIRMWEFYLSYCEAAFLERYLGDVQMLLTKPLCRREPILPLLNR